MSLITRSQARRIALKQKQQQQAAAGDQQQLLVLTPPHYPNDHQKQLTFTTTAKQHIQLRKARTRPATTPKYLKGKSAQRVQAVLDAHRLNEKARYDNLNYFLTYIAALLPKDTENITKNFKTTNILLNLVSYIAFLESKLAGSLSGSSPSFLITDKRLDLVMDIVDQMNMRLAPNSRTHSELSYSPPKQQDSYLSGIGAGPFSNLAPIGFSGICPAVDSQTTTDDNFPTSQESVEDSSLVGTQKSVAAYSQNTFSAQSQSQTLQIRSPLSTISDASTTLISSQNNYQPKLTTGTSINTSSSGIFNNNSKSVPHHEPLLSHHVQDILNSNSNESFTSYIDPGTFDLLPYIL